MNVEGSKVEIRMNEFQNSVFVRIPNHYSLFLVQYSLFLLLGIKTDIHIIILVVYRNRQSIKIIMRRGEND